MEIILKMNKVTFKYTMRRISQVTIIFLLTLVLFSCKKESTTINKNLSLKVIDLDSIGGSDHSFVDIIPLPDNSYWVHYHIKWFSPFKERIEHYDENYSLLNTLRLDRYRFTRFIVNGNNDIVTSGMYLNPSNSSVYHFLKFDNNLNILEKNDSSQIMANLLPLKNKSFVNIFTKLSSGEYVFGFFTTYGFPGNDSANILLASYSNPVQSGKPAWVNKNFYYDVSNDIRQSSLLDIKADNNNNFYVLSESTNNELIVRKHSENGDLIWQRKAFAPNFIDDRNTQLLVDADKVIISSTFNNIYIFDSNGNLTEKTSPFPLHKKMIPTKKGDGYITMDNSWNDAGKYVNLLKFDKNFNLVKTKQYGNQRTNYQSYAGFARLANGEILVHCYVEPPNLEGLHLMQFKVDDDLELIE